jgi:cell wall-associated NlpC family hydrolase
MSVMPGVETTIQQDQTAPRYDWQNGIKRRFETINQMGTDATQFAQEQAAKKQQQTIAAARAVQQNSLTAAQTDASSGFQPNTTGKPGDLRSRIVNYASSFKGTPYVWGGSKPGGFDCSGLVQYVYGKMGVKTPRVSQQQATMGRMTSVRNLKQGDFVAWGNSPATAHHIAIYAGNGMVWEAPHTGANVRLRRISPNEAGIMGISLGI